MEAYFAIKGGSRQKIITREAKLGGFASLVIRQPNGESLEWDLEITRDGTLSINGIVLSAKLPGDSRKPAYREKHIRDLHGYTEVQFREMIDLAGGLHGGDGERD
jgi:hypothetical protein